MPFGRPDEENLDNIGDCLFYLEFGFYNARALPRKARVERDLGSGKASGGKSPVPKALA